MFRFAGMLLLGVGAACAMLPGTTKNYHPGTIEKGIASWYGEPFHGRATASGEIYDMYGITAAHRTLPLGTHVRVTNLQNGRVIKLKVNDRGPFVRGRILDLSYGAAKRLGTVEAGTVRVKIEVLDLPRNANSPFTIQVGAFSLEANARELSGRLKREYAEVSVKSVSSQSGSYYRVQVGHFTNEHHARKTARRIERKEGLQTFVTRRE